jgi:hypothetical protein
MTVATADGRIIARFRGNPVIFVASDHTFTVKKTSQFVPSYHLLRDDEHVASAKRAVFSARYTVESADKVWALKARGLTDRKHALLNGKVETGAIYPISFFNPYREIVIDLPNEIAFEIQVFMTWVVVSSWSDD